LNYFLSCLKTDFFRNNETIIIVRSQNKI